MCIRFSVICLALLCSVAHCAQAQQVSDQDRRVFAKFQTYANAQFDVSSDGRRLHVLSHKAPDQVVLDIYDVSNPAQSVRLSSISYPSDKDPTIAVNADRAFIYLGKFSHPGKLGATGVQIIDISDPFHPKTTDIDFGGFWLSGNISADGKLLAVHYPNDDATRQKYPEGWRVYDLANLNDPKIDDNPSREIRFAMGNDDPRFPALFFPSIRGQILDLRGGALLVRSNSTPTVDIYDVTTTNNPKLIRSLPSRGGYGRARLTSSDAIVFGEIMKNAPGILLYSTQELQLTGPELRAVYQKAADDYRTCRTQPNSNASYCASPLVSKLADAGVEKLLTQDMETIASADRAAILNDYGFWVSKVRLPAPLSSEQVPHGVQILRRVVELAPNRAVAWLNLGDALLDAVAVAPSIAAKQKLAREAIQAYETYQKLTNKDAISVTAAIEVRDRKNFPDNVCTYVVDAFQANRIREISQAPGELMRADGTRAAFTILEGGTAHVPYFASPDGGDLSDEFYVPEQLWTWDDLYIVPYAGRSYVVHANEGELKSVSEPNVGVTCQFNSEVTPKLITNRAPAICKKLLDNNSSSFPELATQAVSSTGSRQDPHLDKDLMSYVVSTSSFDLQGKSVTVARYENSSGAGPGCEYSGVFFVADGKAEDTPRNKALTRAQEEVADCRTSTTTLVSVDGEVLLKLSGRIGGRGGTHTRRLMQIKDDQIEELCRVDEFRSYTPR